MQTFSTSFIRRSSSAALASILRRTGIYHGGCGFRGGNRRSFYFLSARRENPNNNVFRNKFLRAFVAPVLSWDEKAELGCSDAIGTVLIAQGHYMRVMVEEVAVDRDGDERSSNVGLEILCVVKSLLKKIERRVLVGDKVLVGYIDWIYRRGQIENVFHRLSENIDPPVANVDHLLILFSLDQPKLAPHTLTRFLVEAESTKIPLTLALNKCELITQEELESWKKRLRGWNYEPLVCSVITKVGLDAIACNLRNRTSVIVGPSGVGKSSLINILRSNSDGTIDYGEGFKPILGKMSKEQRKRNKEKRFNEQSVEEVSEVSGRGKHTTTNVALLPLPGGGYLADTPGFNKHKLLKLSNQSLPLCFPEIRKMVEGGKCVFNDCSHIEVQGCAVKDDWERYPHYLQLLDEVRVEEESQLKKYGTKKEDNTKYKAGEMGVKKGEARLDPKKYRRGSRKTSKQAWMSELQD